MNEEHKMPGTLPHPNLPGFTAADRARLKLHGAQILVQLPVDPNEARAALSVALYMLNDYIHAPIDRTERPPCSRDVVVIPIGKCERPKTVS